MAAEGGAHGPFLGSALFRHATSCRLGLPAGQGGPITALCPQTSASTASVWQTCLRVHRLHLPRLNGLTGSSALGHRPRRSRSTPANGRYIACARRAGVTTFHQVTSHVQSLCVGFAADDGVRLAVEQRRHCLGDRAAARLSLRAPHPSLCHCAGGSDWFALWPGSRWLSRTA